MSVKLFIVSYNLEAEHYDRLRKNLEPYEHYFIESIGEVDERTGKMFICRGLMLVQADDYKPLLKGIKCKDLMATGYLFAVEIDPSKVQGFMNPSAVGFIKSAKKAQK